MSRTIILTKRVETDTEKDWRKLTIEYMDPEGDETKKSLIEDVINEALEKAEKIMNE